MQNGVAALENIV